MDQVCRLIDFIFNAKITQQELIDVVRDNFILGFKYLLRQGINVHADNDAALRIACEFNYEDIAKIILDITEEFTFESGFYPLAVAAFHGHINIVRLLLDANFDPNEQDSISLEVAAEQGQLEILKLLVERGGDFHADTEMALQLACQYGRIKIVEFLIDNGADIHISDDICFAIACTYNQLELVKILIDRGSNIHISDDYPVRNSIRNGYTDIAKLLIDKGAIVPGLSLKIAAKRGDLEIVRILLQKNIKRYTTEALSAACENGHVEVVSVLYQETGTFLKSDILEAHLRGHTDVVKFLVSKGGSIPVVCDDDEIF